jgi:membrane-associated phospholipid phosphatase
MHGYRQALPATRGFCTFLLRSSLTMIGLERQQTVSTAQLLARSVSDLFNPLLVPPLTIAVLGWLTEIPGFDFWSAVLLASIFYTFLPASAVFTTLKAGAAGSPDFPQRRSRNRLFLKTFLSTAAGSTVITLLYAGSHPFISIAAVIYCLNTFIGYLINLGWKISIHSAALSTMATILGIFYLIQGSDASFTAAIFSLSLISIFLPVMIWARYQLNVHSISELIGGAGTGIAVTGLELYLIWTLSGL